MVHAKSAPTVRVVLGIVAIAIAITVGVLLRLADPLSTPVVPAEDPYTHMALVREHVRDGTLDPLNEKTTLYPPGLHAFLGAAWVYTGTDLYEIVRIGPVVFGAIGILGIALLLWRSEGPLAAFVGAIALAVAPEFIFRSTMMSPTALDLALLPFLLYALLRMVTGRVAWVGVAAPLSVFLVFAHPWLFLVLALSGTAFLLLALIMPWPAERAAPMSALGFAAAAAVIGASLALTGFASPGFQTTLNLPANVDFGLLLALFTVATLLPVILVAVRPRSLDRLMPARTRRPLPIAARLALSAVIAAALALGTLPALQQGMPDLVDLPRMFGWPILLFAALALVALPFVASPTAHLGAAIVAATLPFVLYNPLQSDFWPHRTAVFLGIGLVLLVGVLAGALARFAVHAVTVAAARLGTPTHHPMRRALTTVLPALLVLVLVGGGVYAATPLAYPGGWYRLYHPCEMEAFEEIADAAEEDPSTVVVTGDWQAKLVLSALTANASRIWFKPDFFTDPEERGDLVAIFGREGRPLIVVLDGWLRLENPDADTGFADDPPFVQRGQWCANMGIEQPRVTAYGLAGAKP